MLLYPLVGFLNHLIFDPVDDYPLNIGRYHFTVTITSLCFISSDNFKYSFAIDASAFNGSTRPSKSYKISSTRVRLSSVWSNFCNDSAFRFLYFNTPADSSSICRLSIGLAFKISSTLP